MKHLLPSPNPSVIGLYHWLLVTLITAFQAKACHVKHLDYILSVTQAPQFQNKLSTIFIYQQRDIMKTLGD